jgi:Rrf2 family protein
MKITSQEEYGLRCLLRLALAQGGASPLGIREIAEAEALSIPHVAKLLAVLRQAGLIESVRGRQGGYRLAAPPAEISLGAVMTALGEPLFDEPTFCSKHPGTETTDGRCVHISGCTLRALWHTLEDWMRKALDHITLADLLQSEGRLTELLRARLAEAVLEPTTALIPVISVATAHGRETTSQGMS